MNTEKLSFFDGNITIYADVCNGKPTISRIENYSSDNQVLVRVMKRLLKQYPTLT